MRLANLSKLVDVRTIAQPYGEISVFAGGNALVLNNQASKLSTGMNSQGQLVIPSPSS